MVVIRGVMTIGRSPMFNRRLRPAHDITREDATTGEVAGRGQYIQSDNPALMTGSRVYQTSEGRTCGASLQLIKLKPSDFRNPQTVNLHDLPP